MSTGNTCGLRSAQLNLGSISKSKQVSMLPLAYESFARVVADQVNISFEAIEPFTLLYISAASNYVLWEDEKKFDVQFQYLKKSITTIIEKETSSYGS